MLFKNDSAAVAIDTQSLGCETRPATPAFEGIWAKRLLNARGPEPAQIRRRRSSSSAHSRWAARKMRVSRSLRKPRQGAHGGRRNDITARNQPNRDSRK